MKNQGFTLTELMITVAVLSILAAIALPTYNSQMKKARLNEARSLLLENQHFMEQYYMRHSTFKKDSTTWPDLPKTSTRFFSIDFTSKPAGEMSGGYRLRAKANDNYKGKETRFLEIDHNGNIILCTDNPKRCQSY